MRPVYTNFSAYIAVKRGYRTFGERHFFFAADMDAAKAHAEALATEQTRRTGRTAFVQDVSPDRRLDMWAIPQGDHSLSAALALGVDPPKFKAGDIVNHPYLKVPTAVQSVYFENNRHNRPKWRVVVGDVVADELDCTAA